MKRRLTFFFALATLWIGQAAIPGFAAEKNPLQLNVSLKHYDTNATKKDSLYSGEYVADLSQGMQFFELNQQKIAVLLLKNGKGTHQLYVPVPSEDTPTSDAFLKKLVQLAKRGISLDLIHEVHEENGEPIAPKSIWQDEYTLNCQMEGAISKPKKMHAFNVEDYLLPDYLYGI